MNKKKIVGIFLIVFSYIMLLLVEDKLRAVPGVITFHIIGLILIFKKSKAREPKQEKKNYKKTHLLARHQAGLPLAEGVDCTIEFGDRQFVFQGGGNNFNLTFDKITDVCIKTDVEIHKQFVSSAGGAVTGGMIFGPLGAMIGGRIQEKWSSITNYYLIYTYNKEGEICYISFDVTYTHFKVVKWIKIFKQNYLTGNQQSVNL